MKGLDKMAQDKLAAATSTVDAGEVFVRSIGDAFSNLVAQGIADALKATQPIIEANPNVDTDEFFNAFNLSNLGFTFGSLGAGTVNALFLSDPAFPNYVDGETENLLGGSVSVSLSMSF